MQALLFFMDLPLLLGLLGGPCCDAPEGGTRPRRQKVNKIDATASLSARCRFLDFCNSTSPPLGPLRVKSGAPRNRLGICSRRRRTMLFPTRRLSDGKEDAAFPTQAETTLVFRHPLLSALNRKGATSATLGAFPLPNGSGRQTAMAESPTRAVKRPFSTPSPRRADNFAAIP
jgi:hypothetical protein